MTTVNAKSTAWSWNEENSEKAITMYKAVLEESGPEVANEQANLKKIAQAVGAKSASSVRSKLTSAKVYVKADTPRKVGGGTTLRKIHFVRALSKKAEEMGIEADSDSFDSLESAKMSTLKLLAEMMELEVKE